MTLAFESRHRSVETQTQIYNIACRRYATCRGHGKSCIPDRMSVGRAVCFLYRAGIPRDSNTNVISPCLIFIIGTRNDGDRAILLRLQSGCVIGNVVRNLPMTIPSLLTSCNRFFLYIKQEKATIPSLFQDMFFILAPNHYLCFIIGITVWKQKEK